MKRFCRKCGAPIIGAEDFILDIVSDGNWECRKCFFAKKTRKPEEDWKKEGQEELCLAS